jgi:dTDP-4-amino-4,6-dideoxygalactose transaminase
MGTVGSDQLPRIRVLVPQVGLDTAQHVVAALDMRWLGMGSLVKEFEDRISAFLEVGDRKVVSTNTGTAAIHIGLLAAGVGPGDEVIVPSFNYVADHQAVRMTGAEVVFCDIRDDVCGIDVEKAEALVTQRTKAIIPLHFAGIPCDQRGVYEMAKRRGLRVVEDACHAFGTRIDGKRIGSYGDIACFSFDPVKIITSVDGGCVVVNTEDEMEQLRRLRQLGVDKDTLARYKQSRGWEYDVLGPGFRYHLTDIAASVGISQIKQAEQFIASRQTVCRRYSEAFSRIDGLATLETDFTDVSPFIYSLRVLNGRRDEMIDHLRRLNIESGIHFISAHKLSYFQNAPTGDLSVTERVVGEVITLPLHSHMREEFVERVIEGVTSFFDRS